MTDSRHAILSVKSNLLGRESCLQDFLSMPANYMSVNSNSPAWKKPGS